MPTTAEGSVPPSVERGPLFTPAFIGLAVAELAYFLAVGMMYAVVPLFVLGPLGSDEVGSGVAFGAFFVTALILRPVAGRISDRAGRRPLLIGGALAFAALVAAHVLVTDLAALVVLRLCLGVAEAFFFVAAVAALADLAPPGREGEALSINSLSLYLGIAFGPLIGERLVDAGGYDVAWMAAAGLALAAGVLATRLPETRPEPTEGWPSAPSALIHRGAIGPSLALFTGVAAMAGFLSVATPHAQGLGMGGAGTVALLFGFIVVGTRVILSTLPDRVPPLRLITLALAAMALGLLVLGSSSGVPGVYAGTALAAFGVAFLTPAVFALIFVRVRPSERGSATGTASFFIDLGFGGGPVLIGFVAASAGYSAGLVLMALVAAAGAVGTVFASRRARPTPEAASTPSA